MNSQSKILIVGLGLLGTSLAMALRGVGGRRLLGWTRRAETRRWALEKGILDETADSPEELLAAADLTVLAVPIPQVIDYLGRYAHCWRPGSIVTDTGSIKRAIMKAAERSLTPRGVNFVGSHPMAGTEKSGPEAAFETLYRNADVFLCAPCGIPESAVRAVDEMWSALGTHTIRIDADVHDRIVARSSHLPHILASALANNVLHCDDPAEKMRRFAGCAGGFRDTSRIASSNPAMWREVIEFNRDEVLAAMREFDAEYEKFRRLIIDGDFDRFEAEFARGRDLRGEWLEYMANEKRKIR